MTVVRTGKIEAKTVVVTAGKDSIAIEMASPTYADLVDAHVDPDAVADRMAKALGRVRDWEDVVDENGAKLPFSLPLLKGYFADHPEMFQAFHKASEESLYGTPAKTAGNAPGEPSGQSSEEKDPTT